MNASVVIPYYRGLDILDRTIAGLARQTYAGEWEVVVAEDGSPEPSTPLVDKYPQVEIRRVTIPRRGFRVASALNAGIRSAEGDAILVLAFDCVPLPTHLELHMRALQASELVATVGLRRFVDLTHVPPESILRAEWWHDVPSVPSASADGWSFDHREGTLGSIATHPCPSDLFYSCNVGFSRRVGLEVGLFDTAFDGAHGYEDLEFGWRLQEHGVSFVYVDAPVYHQENQVVDRHDRSEGNRRNYSLLSRIARELVAYREGGGA